jgi:endonuclease/exonuclease/phosphatase family metal-dependent hydrolase
MTATRLALHLPAWLGLLAMAGLLWNLANRRVPNPWEFVAVVSICVLGGAGLLGYGLVRGRTLPRLLSATCVLIGIFTIGTVAVFVMMVLTNEDAGVPVFGRADKPTAAVTRLRLFNLNVDHGYPSLASHENRYAETRDEIRRLDADLIVLQEVWNTQEHRNLARRLSDELGYQFAYARANGSIDRIGFEEGSAVLSRFPIVEARRMCLKPRRPWWETRIALIVRIDLGTEAITIAGVHLSNSESANDQAEFLLEDSRTWPDLIAGDFNAEPTSRAVREFDARGFVELMPKKNSPLPWIDHVFLAPAFANRWEVTDASWILATEPVIGVRSAISDHNGILVELRRR